MQFGEKNKKRGVVRVKWMMREVLVKNRETMDGGKTEGGVLLQP